MPKSTDVPCHSHRYQKRHHALKRTPMYVLVFCVVFCIIGVVMHQNLPKYAIYQTQSTVPYAPNFDADVDAGNNTSRADTAYADKADAQQSIAQNTISLQNMTDDFATNTLISTPTDAPLNPPILSADTTNAPHSSINDEKLQMLKSEQQADKFHEQIANIQQDIININKQKQALHLQKSRGQLAPKDVFINNDGGNTNGNFINSGADNTGYNIHVNTPVDEQNSSDATHVHNAMNTDS